MKYSEDRIYFMKDGKTICLSLGVSPEGISKP